MDNNDEQEDLISINDQDGFDYLIQRIENGPLFSEAFHFKDDQFFNSLLDYFDVKYEKFIEKYFYYDRDRNIHIAESSNGYIWISTYGLVAKGKISTNSCLNACFYQYTVISNLFEKAITISEDESVYDVDGYNFGYLSELTPALFHNVLFYIEVFFKAYLSLSGAPIPHIHELVKILDLVSITMIKNTHNNSLFHAYIVTEYKKIVDYIKSIPGGFKEHFVKYDDNPEDGTVVIFNSEALKDIKKTIDMSHDFINGYYYGDEDNHYLRTGLLQRLLDKAETEEDIERITQMYGYLIE